MWGLFIRDRGRWTWDSSKQGKFAPNVRFKLALYRYLHGMSTLPSRSELQTYALETEFLINNLRTNLFFFSFITFIHPSIHSSSYVYFFMYHIFFRTLLHSVRYLQEISEGASVLVYPVRPSSFMCNTAQWVSLNSIQGSVCTKFFKRISFFTTTGPL
jgi:hypothetical protein